jgi:hypothetical protein
MSLLLMDAEALALGPVCVVLLADVLPNRLPHGVLGALVALDNLLDDLFVASHGKGAAEAVEAARGTPRSQQRSPQDISRAA